MRAQPRSDRIASFGFPRAGLAGLIGVGLAGCMTSGERYSSTPDRPPAMPTVALASVADLPPAPPVETDVVAAAARAARANDLAGATRAVATIAEAPRRSLVAQRVVAELGAEDSRLAVRSAVELANGLQQPGLVDGPARNFARSESDAALRWMVELPADPMSRTVQRSAVDELVAMDARGTLERIAALPAGPSRDELIVTAAGAWARRDFDAAIAWLRAQPESALKPRLISNVGFEVAHTRPDRALEVADMLPAGRDRWLLFSAIGQTWVAVDSKAALTWAAKQPAGEPRDAAFAGIDTGYGVPVSRRSSGAPGTRGSYRTRGGAAAVALQSEAGSPDFTAWLALQPPGMSRDEATLEYVRQRGALQPAAVGPFIESLPAGPTRDQAASLYVEGLLTGSPAEAARWVRSLPRSERNDELIEKTLRSWLVTNPDAAMEWLQQSTLPPFRKEQLLREAGR